MVIYKFFYKIKKIFRVCLSFLIAPQSCICCGCECYDIPLCNDCQKKLLSSAIGNNKHCKICGKILFSEENICTACREEPVLKHLDGVIPLYSYRLWKKDLLYQWKIEDVRTLSFFFSEAINMVLAKNFNSLPVVPVPPRPNKIRKKGWDQISELVSYLSVFYNVKVLKLLKRVNVQQQKKLNREQRLEHIEKSFVLKNNKTKLPKEVVIIDDIMTTGSTLESCATILKQNGVEKVYAVTLFIAD